MNGVVITGGLCPPELKIRGYLAAADVVVAADSGLDSALAYGVRPNIVVGDFDSLSSPELLNGFDDVRRYSRDKDYTDTELGIVAVMNAGAEEVTLIGGGGGRLDHLLGIYELFHRAVCPRRWITDQAYVEAVTGDAVFHGTVGDTISFLPVGETPCRMQSTGLRWPLDDVVWRRGDVGLSNEFSSAEARVHILSGRLVMIRPIGDA